MKNLQFYSKWMILLHGQFFSKNWYEWRDWLELTLTYVIMAIKYDCHLINIILLTLVHSQYLDAMIWSGLLLYMEVYLFVCSGLTQWGCSFQEIIHCFELPYSVFCGVFGEDGCFHPYCTIKNITINKCSSIFF